MDNIGRLTNLMEGTKFKSTPDWSSRYPLMDLGKHNLAEFNKLGEEQEVKISKCISAIMADFFQPLALKQFGHTGDSAMQTVVYNKLFPTDEAQELNSMGQQVRKEVLGIGLSEEQVEKLYQWFLSYFPAWLVASVVELINLRDLVKRLKIIWEVSEGGDEVYKILTKGGQDES